MPAQLTNGAMRDFANYILLWRYYEIGGGLVFNPDTQEVLFETQAQALEFEASCPLAWEVAYVAYADQYTPSGPAYLM